MENIIFPGDSKSVVLLFLNWKETREMSLNLTALDVAKAKGR